MSTNTHKPLGVALIEVMTADFTVTARKRSGICARRSRSTTSRSSPPSRPASVAPTKPPPATSTRSTRSPMTNSANSLQRLAPRLLSSAVATFEQALDARTSGDYRQFAARHLFIRSKSGVILPLTFNRAQQAIHAALEQQRATLAACAR